MFSHCNAMQYNALVLLFAYSKRFCCLPYTDNFFFVFFFSFMKDPSSFFFKVCLRTVRNQTNPSPFPPSPFLRVWQISILWCLFCYCKIKSCPFFSDGADKSGVRWYQWYKEYYRKLFKYTNYIDKLRRGYKDLKKI